MSKWSKEQREAMGIPDDSTNTVPADAGKGEMKNPHEPTEEYERNNGSWGTHPNPEYVAWQEGADAQKAHDQPQLEALRAENIQAKNSLADILRINEELRIQIAALEAQLKPVDEWKETVIAPEHLQALKDTKWSILEEDMTEKEILEAQAELTWRKALAAPQKDRPFPDCPSTCEYWTKCEQDSQRPDYCPIHNVFPDLLLTEQLREKVAEPIAIGFYNKEISEGGSNINWESYKNLYMEMSYPIADQILSHCQPLIEAAERKRIGEWLNSQAGITFDRYFRDAIDRLLSGLSVEESDGR